MPEDTIKTARALSWRMTQLIKSREIATNALLTIVRLDTEGGYGAIAKTALENVLKTLSEENPHE